VPVLSGAHAPQDVADVVLLSGGVDSAAALSLAREGERNVTALFIDYGQPAASRERIASGLVATHYGISGRHVSCNGMHFGPGEIRGRNALLVHMALLSLVQQSGRIILGIHAGTPYRDCSPEFVRVMQDSLDFHTGGRVSLVAPFIDHSKSEVYGIARRLGVPVGLTYSCEAGNEPCGGCLSCRDRQAMNAGT
jgi:7-cyano-7-deazaguanine synthase